MRSKVKSEGGLDFKSKLHSESFGLASALAERAVPHLLALVSH